MFTWPSLARRQGLLSCKMHVFTHTQVCLSVERRHDVIQRQIRKTGKDWGVSEKNIRIYKHGVLCVQPMTLTSAHRVWKFTCLICRFTMVFSELPDMSDPSHEFAQQYQKPLAQVSFTPETRTLWTQGSHCLIRDSHNTFMVPCPDQPSLQHP